MYKTFAAQGVYKSFCCGCCCDVFCTRCDANNGIPPPVKQEFSVEVQCEMIEETKKHITTLPFSPPLLIVPPLITIRTQMVGSYVGGSAVLECLVENDKTINAIERRPIIKL